MLFYNTRDIVSEVLGSARDFTAGDVLPTFLPLLQSRGSGRAVRWDIGGAVGQLCIRLQDIATLQFGTTVESACFPCFCQLLLGSAEIECCPWVCKRSNFLPSLLESDEGIMICMLSVSCPAGHGHNYTRGETEHSAAAKLLFLWCFLFCSLTHAYFPVKNCYFLSYIFASKPCNF